uniref:Serine/threonine-protein phosphatase 4 regulatory subunit 1 n=1 Tax=Elaeophora elaphi TaxID=1147741 RepID=A0A0R3RZG3_9BILA
MTGFESMLKVLQQLVLPVFTFRDSSKLVLDGIELEEQREANQITVMIMDRLDLMVLSFVETTCITILGKLAVMFGRNFTEQFAVPFLIASSEDLAWGVRKSSCEVFVDVAKNCTMETKERKLAPRFITLLHDTSRWVTHVAFQQLGRFIATFADADPDIEEDGESTRNNSRSNGKVTVDDENELYCQLPPGVVFPESDVCDELGEPSNSSSPQDQSYVLNELTCLFDSWDAWAVSNDSIASNSSLIHDFMNLDIENGVAASCSTHSDLTKLILGDNDSSGEEDDGIEESCPIDVENDDEPSRMDENDDLNAYYPLVYWSSKSFDIDLRSYGKNATASHDNSNNKKDKNNIKKLVSEFIQRRSDLFYDASKHKMNLYLKQVHQPLPLTLLEMVKIGSRHLLPLILQLSFPAVAFTLGRNNWPCIMGAYKQLASDMQWRVRQTLASSIHEIAAIIGKENADAHLVPVFERFMEDVEDVKLGLLNHLYDFFKLVTPTTRQKLLSILPNFLHSDADSGRNWRYRYEYVRQCILLCDLFAMHDINKYLAAIALTLANDRISDVRKEATILLAKILGKFVSEEWTLGCTDSCRSDMSFIPITDSFITDIVKGFARSMNWRRRQTFALFCEKSLESEVLNYDQFSLLLLNDLMRLAGDSVANVRLAFVRSLSKTRGGYAFRGSRDPSIVHHSLEALLSDKDVDCRRAARISLGIPDSENAVDAKDYAQRLRETNKIFVSAKYHTDQLMSSDHETR